MYDMRALRTRYYDIKLPDGKVLNVEPPKMNILNKLQDLQLASTAKMNESDAMDRMEGFALIAEALSLALSKNKQKFDVSVEYISKHFQIMEIHDVFADYFNWVGSTLESKN